MKKQKRAIELLFVREKKGLYSRPYKPRNSFANILLNKQITNKCIFDHYRRARILHSFECMSNTFIEAIEFFIYCKIKLG